MNYLIVIIAAIVGTVWWLGIRPGRSAATVSTRGANELNDDELVKLQMGLERSIVSGQDLPDATRGRKAYIYWNLMRNWFSQLNAAYRYDEAQVQRLRRDWRDYIDLLPRVTTSQFLALEASSSAKASEHSEEAELASRKIELIENAFAAAVGESAIDRLRQVRSRDADAFDRTGTKPMAPVGHHYFPISLNPYVEECQPSTT